MKRSKKKRQPRLTHDELYQARFGEVPNVMEDRLDILFDTRMIEKVKKNVDTTINDLKRVKRNKVTFVWYTEPHPSQRPRANLQGGYVHMYVPLAAATKMDFQVFMKNSFPNFTPISTPMSFHIKAYLKTPDSFSRTHKILAELGIIRPWGRVADCDNILKAYTDCTINTLIVDDSLIDDMRSQKYYSTKPRVEFEIIYYDRWPKGLIPIKREGMK